MAPMWHHSTKASEKELVVLPPEDRLLALESTEQAFGSRRRPPPQNDFPE